MNEHDPPQNTSQVPECQATSDEKPSSDRSGRESKRCALHRRAVLIAGATSLTSWVAGTAVTATSTQKADPRTVSTQSTGYGGGGYGQGPYGDSTGAPPQNPFPSGVPGVGSQPPENTDSDPQFEDIDGDGTATFDDAIDLAFADFDAINNGSQAQIDALDFDEDGDIDFDDAIELAFQI